MADGMVSMKRTAADKRAEKLSQSPAEATAPDYPWGLCIHLDRDELEKLGINIKKPPAVGTEITVAAKAKVTRVSQSAAENSDDQTSIDVQITDMKVD